MTKNPAPLALDRSGYVTGCKIKPKKIGAKGDLKEPSTIVLVIETASDPGFVALLQRIMQNGEAIVFGIEPAQSELALEVDGQSLGKALLARMRADRVREANEADEGGLDLEGTWTFDEDAAAELEA